MDIEFVNRITEQLIESGVSIIDPCEITIFKPHLAEGGFGKVYKGKFKDNTVAVKKFKKLHIDDKTPQTIYFNTLKSIVNEIQVINIANHNSFPKFYGVAIKKCILFVFEFIEGDTLNNLYMNLNLRTKLEIIKQLLEILADIHFKKIIHRDIKPQNIMIEPGNKVRLIDFGISRIFEKTLTYTANATYSIYYTAPEVVDPQIIDQCYTDKPMIISAKIDVWSVGCIISEIFSGVIPWRNVCRNEVAITRKLLFKQDFPVPDEIMNEEIKTLIRKACTVDHISRPSSKDFLKILRNVILNIAER